MLRCRARALLWLACGCALPSAAAAAPLPDALVTMIREAHPKERRTIVNVAKRLYPQSIDDINAVVAKIEGEKRAALAGSPLAQGWTGEASLGGFFESGNTDEWGVSASVEAQRKGVRWSHEISARVDVKEESGERTQERAYGRYTLRRTLARSRWFAFGRLSYERDRLQGIERRFFESVGMGYQLIKSPTVQWDAMAGPAFRQTNYSDGASVDEPAIFARSKLEWKISDRLLFSEEIDAGLADANSTFTSTTALTSNLYGRLSGRVSLGVEVETDPPLGREKTDTYTRLSLIYAF